MLWKFKEEMDLFDELSREDSATLAVQPLQIALTQDGTLLASIQTDSRELQLWDLGTGIRSGVLRANSELRDISIAADDVAATAGMNGELTLWNLQTKKQVYSFAAHDGPAAVTFSHDGQRIATACRETGRVRVWDRSGNQLMSIEVVGVKDVALSPAGVALAVGHRSGIVTIWDVKTSSLLSTMAGHKDVVGAVMFSPDGRLVAAASWDGTLTLWDDFKGQHQLPKKRLIGHSGPVWDVLFADDRVVLSSSGDGTVKVWDTATGAERCSLKTHPEGAVSLSYCRGLLAVGSQFFDKIEIFRAASREQVDEDLPSMSRFLAW
jgi:WD40 repeat protein